MDQDPPESSSKTLSTKSEEEIEQEIFLEIASEKHYVSPDLPAWYTEHVATNREYYSDLSFQGHSREEFSPCGNYRLVVSWYKSKPGYMGLSRGTVLDVTTHEVIADIYRNYPHFWSCWASQNGKSYLLCGEDYQGYTVVDLANKTTTHCVPSGAEKGHGFCWITVEQQDDILVVVGCFWACPEERREYDFSNPEQLPYKLLKREDVVD